MVLRTQCKGIAEVGNDGINVLKTISNVALKAHICKVGESRCVVWMADRAPVQNQLKMLHKFIQMRLP